MLKRINFPSSFLYIGCLYTAEADVVNEVQSATQTEQDLSVAVHTDIAVDMHACNDRVGPQ